MERITRLIGDALGAAPRERVLIAVICAVLCVAGVALIGVAAFHALAERVGPQAARLGIGGLALALAGAVWAIGAVRARRRRLRSTAARAELAHVVTSAAQARTGLAGPAVAFLLAFLRGRKR